MFYENSLDGMEAIFIQTEAHFVGDKRVTNIICTAFSK